ncbi:MAG: DUF1918 domain-containing protein, partial [Actinomycetes bacterium]
LTVKGRHQGDEERHGEIIKVDEADGAPPYVVRWRDGHETVFFPAYGTEADSCPDWARRPCRYRTSSKRWSAEPWKTAARSR